MSKVNNQNIHEYHLNLHEPSKQQFKIYEMHSYLKDHGEKASKPHIHSYYQIIWFKKGTGKHYVDFKEYEVTDNSLFFIAKNQVHYFDDSIDYHGVIIVFNESFIVQKDSEVEFFLKCNIFKNPYQRPSCCVGTDMSNILNQYLALINLELNHEDDFGQGELLRMYLRSFLVQVQRTKIESEKSIGEESFYVDDKKMLLIHFNNLIDEHYKEGLSIAQYAALLFISARTLSDLTNQLLGKSPSMMVQERIVLEAKRLLLHSDQHVNQVGYTLGFEDPSYFVKYFKKHTKMSPTEFKKSIS